MNFENVVLLVDDDLDDRELLQNTLKELDMQHASFLEAGNGVEALDMLMELSKRERLPCLIVLDLNMPKMDGKETFLTIRNHAKLSKIPIVIFSTSNSLLDKTFFQKHNTAYFVKPVSFVEFKKTATKLINMCYHNSHNHD